ncbi:Xanthine dehydrogenase accessory factor [Desulfovibrionales bacterium]
MIKLSPDTSSNSSRQIRFCIIIRGAGDLATGVALSLYRAGYHCLILLETPTPMAVRRRVALAEAVHLGRYIVEGLTAVRAHTIADLPLIWAAGELPLLVDPAGTTIAALNPAIVIDAILAKRNTGTTVADAPLVIGLGPGFRAGEDVHCVIETQRGSNLGLVITKGPAAANTGIPSAINGYTTERVLRAPLAGWFHTRRDIGHTVTTGGIVGRIVPETTENTEVLVHATIDGVLHGLLRDATFVSCGTKLGDVNPQADPSFCHLVSDKALTVGAGVVSAVRERFPILKTHHMEAKI